MTQRQAERAVIKWKRLLGLDGWDVRFEAKHTMDVGACGLSRIARHRRINTVVIALPHSPAEDAESTIVHELLHAYFDMHDMDEKDYAYVRTEQGVDMVANLLVRLSRESQRTTAPRKPDRRRKPARKGRRDHS